MFNITYRPKKSLGQNFLIDENIAKKIIASLSLNREDHVLEIGAGYGILTKYIVSQVNKLIAVEIDKNLSHSLRNKFEHHSNFHLIEDNFLTLSLDEILNMDRGWKIVSNTPYHITSSIIFKLFKFKSALQSLTLMLQKEVAQRITAKPNTKFYGILSILSYLFADVKILFFVSRNVFVPKPEVDSAIVQWNFLPQNRYFLEDENFFIQMIKAIFGQRRKLIKNSLKTLAVSTEKIDYQLTKRPEQLSVAELVHLSNLVTYGRERH